MLSTSPVSPGRNLFDNWRLVSVLTTVPQLFMQVFVSIVWFLDIFFSQYLSVFVTCILMFSMKPSMFLFIVL